ncbi:RNA polymerase sigma-70 factor [Streptosporangium roseum]|uniref:RNA polymerase sigma-70 factor n=1 Tax=Streptosporangium roseum TaxID=2001 RepID=UPI0007C82BAE|nr:RNA polymerase sigma-70 factor [Streptosporangium roseum]
MNAESLEQADALDRAASAFAELRPWLFGIAYRMLASAAEAEDIVQEVWLRWQGTDRETIENPPAFLALVTTRLAINLARSARVRRESYIGPWLPEPVDTSLDPTVGAERGEALELAVLLLMERLKPTERAAYVLREAFDYPYTQIAEILRLTPANVRQIVSRARKRLTAVRHEPVNRVEHRRLLETFLDAARTGNVGALEKLFAADVVSSSDGGGVRGSSTFPVLGSERVARFVAAFSPRFWPGATVTWVEMNGLPGMLVSRDGSDVALLAIEASREGIHHLLWMLNPTKIESFRRSRSRIVTTEGGRLVLADDRGAAQRPESQKGCQQ